MGRKQIERQRESERTGSKWKMQGTSTAEMQMGRRKHNEFMSSKGWHLTETGSEGEPQPEGNILVIRGCFPS